VRREGNIFEEREGKGLTKRRRRDRVRHPREERACEREGFGISGSD
jgi:hypothetical protein